MECSTGREPGCHPGQFGLIAHISPSFRVSPLYSVFGAGYLTRELVPLFLVPYVVREAAARPALCRGV